MYWKEHLRKLELNKQWDQAIEFMQMIIEANPDDMDSYIYMNFLLMNLLVEESHNENKHGNYVKLLKKYFKDSYAKFSNNAEYLFCTGVTAVMSEWYMGITAEDYERMLLRAIELDPINLLYKKTYYINLDEHIFNQKIEILNYANLIINNDPVLAKEWAARGALGEYLKDCQLGWAKYILGQ